MKSGNFICSDFSGDTLKIAYCKIFPNKKEISHLAMRNIRGLPDMEVSKIIRTILNDAGIKSASVINLIPSPLVITRNIEVPSRDRAEIEEIINLQAGRLTPYAREDIILDYVNIGVYRKSYTKLLLITATRSLIKKQLDILLGAGLNIERVCFSAEGVTHFIWQYLKLENDNAVINILNIDTNFTDFIVAHKNKVIFVRGIPIGIEHLAAAKDQHQPRLIEEVKKSIEAYAGEDIEQAPSRIIITGDPARLKELETVLGSSLLLPVSTVFYLKHLSVSDQSSKIISSAVNASFFNVVAPLVGLNEMKINLITEEIKYKRQLEEKGKEIVKSGILIMAFFVLVCAILTSNIYFKGIYLKNLNSLYTTKHEEAQKLEGDFSKIQVVRNYLSRRGYSLGTVDELYNIVSASVQLNEIRFDRQGKFSIKGSAESMSAVFSLIDDMGRSDLFKDVKSKYTTKRKEGDKELVDFEIVSLLKDAAKGK